MVAILHPWRRILLRADCRPHWTTKIRDRVGRSLQVFIADLRDRGSSFMDIAFEIRMVTGRPVSHEAVRAWCREWGIK